MKKSINSFNDVLKIRNKDLFTIDQDKNYKIKKLDKKLAVSIARKLSTGFDVDLRKPITRYRYNKALRTIDEFYSNIKYKDVTFIRPSKKNRKAYSKYTDLPSNFKIYPVIKKQDDIFRVVKGKVRKSNRFIITEDFLYEDLDNFNVGEFIEDTKPYTKELIKKAKRESKNKKDLQFKIKCGVHNSGFQTIEEKELIDEVERYMQTYKDTEQWLKGIHVFSFKNQN